VVVVSGERIRSICGRSKQTGTRGLGRDPHNSGSCQLLCFVAIFRCEPDGWRAAAAELSSNSCRPTGLRCTSSRHDCHNGASGAAGLHGFATVPEAVARGPIPRAVRLKRKRRPKPCRIRPAHIRLPISLTLYLPLNRLTAHPRHRVRLPPRRRRQIQIPPTRCRIPNNRCLSFSRNSRAPPNSRSGLLHPVATRKGAWLSGDDPLSIR
jgi:hypothetical protein